MNGSPPNSSVHRDAPGKNTGVGYHALLQGLFLTQGSNPGLPNCRQILYQLSYQGNPYWTYSRVILGLKSKDSLILQSRKRVISVWLFFSSFFFFHFYRCFCTTNWTDVAETTWPAKPNVFTLWPFKVKVCQNFLQSKNAYWVNLKIIYSFLSWF